MEIRRCDKCQVDIDLEHIKDLHYHTGDIRGLRFEVPFPVSRKELNEMRRQDGLDDKDEFGPSLIDKKIDLCESCVIEFASIMKLWLNNVRVNV